MNNKLSPSLARATRRAADQPFFLASVFEAYQSANQLDNAQLASLIGCALNDIPRLALCRRPAANESSFASDIAHLADRFQLNGDQLAAIIRHIDALHELRQHLSAATESSGLLRAARDRDDLDNMNAENTDD